MGDLDVYATARAMVRATHAGDVSARELLELHLARIDEVNPSVNAVVSLDAERALQAASAADRHRAGGGELGPLHGLPFAVKDTHALAGWRTTYGSPLLADNVAEHDELLVARIRAAGAIMIGKTNVPEFAAGSHTFNAVFGVTRNPYDLSRSAGGSSGGAAAALAAGMVPLADGSDMGGSLRNPASFCNVVGLRPSLGRVPEWPQLNGWEATAVGGPMARTVADLSLLLSVIAGPHPRAPQSLAAEDFTCTAAPRARRACEWPSPPDLGGQLEVDDGVRAVVHLAATALRRCWRARHAGPSGPARGRIGIPHPTGLELPRTVRRAARRATRRLQACPGRQHPGRGRPDRRRHRAGLLQRTALGNRMVDFFDRYDVLLMPVSQVPPFLVEEEYPTTISGKPMTTYLDWMRSAYVITVTGCPAISVPAGFTPAGLPVGIQLVARHNQERRLLEIAAAFEALTRVGERRPQILT